jgi:hypothetical protein
VRLINKAGFDPSSMVGSLPSSGKPWKDRLNPRLTENPYVGEPHSRSWLSLIIQQSGNNGEDRLIGASPEFNHAVRFTPIRWERSIREEKIHQKRLGSDNHP